MIVAAQIVFIFIKFVSLILLFTGPRPGVIVISNCNYL